METTKCTFTLGEEGNLKIKGAKTLETYSKLKYENDAPMEGCFFAFSNEQFYKGYEKIKHLLGENEKIVSVGNGTGLYGIRKYINRFFDFYKNKKNSSESNATRKRSITTSGTTTKPVSPTTMNMPSESSLIFGAKKWQKQSNAVMQRKRLTKF